MPGGRPTKYKEEYCLLLVSHMAQGYSFESFGGEQGVGVSKDTLYQWVKRHQEFSDAKKRGYTACLNFWEKIGRAGVLGIKQLTGKDGKVLDLKGFNCAMWIYNMKCRFREEWNEIIAVREEDPEYKTPQSLQLTDGKAAPKTD